MANSDDIQYSLPHDSANALILPSKKRKRIDDGDEKSASKSTRKAGNKKKRNTQRDQQLSKKKLKQLQKVLDNKRKKSERRAVLEKLQQYQVSDTERKLFGSMARIGMKEITEKHTNDEDGLTMKRQRNSIAGSRRGKRLNETEMCVDTTSGTYFETDSSSDSDVNDEEIGNQSSQIESKITRVEDSDRNRHERSEATKPNTDTFEINTSPSDQPSFVPKFNATTSSPPKTTPLPTIYVPVYRTEEIQEARLKLPILAEEQAIVEAIKEHPVVIICGETGSGKTTQVPQFLYEAGFCANGYLIGVTEPRRVAAISMSRRVAEEMNLDSSIISYQIRYEGNVTENTSIKFMTDGVLLKEIQNDFLLSKYSAIIIDEAHERSMYSDILIGLLSRIVPLREKRNDRPLKLIIMSATLRVEDFTQKNLFRSEIPPVLQVETRQFPVTIHFNRITPDNYLAAAYKRISEIHKLSAPDGGILVFVSGQREVTTLIRWLRRRFPLRKDGDRKTEHTASDNEDKEEKMAAKSLKRLKRKQKKRQRSVKDLPNFDLDEFRIDQSTGNAEGDSNLTTDIGGELDILESDALDLALFENDEEWELDDLELGGSLNDEMRNNYQPLYCLPLYSLLSSVEQRKVFQSPPEGCRLCVIATNVAETSLTIPNIKYVVDTGKEKVRVYDGVAGVSKFLVQWISKASANQRAGRAGRTSAGHCYRLYSSAVFNDFETFSRPEILNKPVEELMLQMKNMNILKVVNFPFPTSPDREVLKVTEERLLKLGALIETDGQLKITPLGRTIALFPVKPEFGKMISLGNQYDLLPYVICLVAILSVREPLKLVGNGCIFGDQDKQANGALQVRRSWVAGSAGTGRRSQTMLLGDVSVLLRAMIEFERETGSVMEFCQRCGIRLEAMIEARKMRRQLTDIISRLAPDLNLSMDNELKPPNERQALLLRQVLLSGLGEHVAAKVDPASVVGATEAEKKKLKKAYRSAKMVDFVYIHPSSILYRTQPRYVIYQEIVETTKKYMHTVTAVESEWLSVYAENYSLSNL